MTLAPIAVFIYNRPEHAARMLQHLAACPEFAQSPLYVYSDGPRTESDVLSVNEVRRVAKSMLGARGILVEHPDNRGIANSIINGVTELCRRFGRVIVVEDDLLVDPTFLQFMNGALIRYEADTRIMQVSGHAFDVPEFDGRDVAVTLPFITSWGWGTWQRAWEQFDPICVGWEQLRDNRALRQKFNLDGSFDYYSILLAQLQGRSDAWDIRWTWSVFREGGLVIYPPKSLVVNIGFDGSGTHGWRSARRALGTQVFNSHRRVTIKFPEHAQIVEADYRLVKRAVKKVSGGIMWKVARWIGRSL